jgi:hypothetical protein
MRSTLERSLDRVIRCELLAIAGLDTLDPSCPPGLVLQDIARHAGAMQPRLSAMVAAHGLKLRSRRWFAIGRWFRSLGVRRLDQAFRELLVELRTGIAVVERIRGLARDTGVFGIIRWCDDWLAGRRLLMARLEAQFPWFMTEQRSAGTSARH